MRQDVLRVEHGDVYPVLDGLVDIPLVEEEIGGPKGCIDGFLEMTGPLEELCQFLHGHGIGGRDLGNAFVDLQRLLVIALLEERQPQAVEGLGMVGYLLQGLTIGDRSLPPFLVPGCGVSFIHCFLENVFSSGHVGIIS